MYYDDEDLNIVSVGEADTVGTYVFELKHLQTTIEFRNVLLFARQQLLQVILQKGYNVLLLESWSLTLYRKGKQHRVEVRYGGRPARVLGKMPALRPPPFMAVLEGECPRP